MPGSGKSTLAKKITKNSYHFEADMFFINDDGEYVYDRNKASDAHKWCQELCAEKLSKGHTVVVSNTFTTKEEMEPYLSMAERFSIDFIIFKVVGNFESVHGVPKEVIEKMMDRWESSGYNEIIYDNTL